MSWVAKKPDITSLTVTIVLPFPIVNCALSQTPQFVKSAWVRSVIFPENVATPNRDKLQEAGRLKETWEKNHQIS